jgi:hypothetical protein
MTSATYDDGPVGEAPCPRCKRTVYYAWDDEMNSIPLDPALLDGPVAVMLDGNRLPWCRDARGSQLAFGESLYRLHDPTCPGLATVTPIGRAPSLRRRSVRATTPRRQASAR